MHACTTTVPWQPEVVFGTNLQPGRCWLFPGSVGHIRITLAERVIVTNITLEHVLADLTPQTDTAPRDVMMWVFINYNMLETYWSCIANSSIVSAIFPASTANLPKSMPLSYFIHIMSFMHNLHSRYFQQIFQTMDEVHDIPLSVRVVVMQVQSNWGNSNRTCLYSVHVHGISYTVTM